MDIYMATGIVMMGFGYLQLGFYFTEWSKQRRRESTERQRTQSEVADETVHNWETVFHFNRIPYEQQRYEDATESMTEAAYHDSTGAISATAFQEVFLTICFTGCSVLAIT
jgi:ABC-type transport system involved in Fe-S cluster assembly fused permease/ATPase subunit